jgi:hypothetical protein
VKIFEPTDMARQLEMFGKAPDRGEPQRQPVTSGATPYGQ